MPKRTCRHVGVLGTQSSRLDELHMEEAVDCLDAKEAEEDELQKQSSHGSSARFLQYLSIQDEFCDAVKKKIVARRPRKRSVK